jgi:hypothetical protein
MSAKMNELYNLKVKEEGQQMSNDEQKNRFKIGFSFIVVVMFLFLLIGCGTTTNTDMEESNQPAAVLEAQSWLAGQLNVSVDEIEIVSSEQVEWTDSCFGLGGAAESCAVVITPGWRANFEVSGQQYEVRFGETGTIARSPQLP